MSYLPLERKFYRKFKDLLEIKIENMGQKNDNLEKLYNKPNIKFFLKVKQLKDGHVWLADKKLLRNVLI